MKTNVILATLAATALMVVGCKEEASFDEAGQAISDAAEKTSEAVADSADKVADSAKEAYDETKDAVKAGTEKVKEGAEKTGAPAYIASECPLAGMHLLQGIERLRMEGKPEITASHHPIEIFARAYGLV